LGVVVVVVVVVVVIQMGLSIEMDIASLVKFLGNFTFFLNLTLSFDSIK